MDKKLKKSALNGLMADVRSLVTDKRVAPLVRGRAAYSLAQDENGVTWLTELLESVLGGSGENNTDKELREIRRSLEKLG